MTNDQLATPRMHRDGPSTVATAGEVAPDALLAYRERFPILARTNYLISNSLGAAPDSAASTSPAARATSPSASPAPAARGPA